MGADLDPDLGFETRNSVCGTNLISARARSKLAGRGASERASRDWARGLERERGDDAYLGSGSMGDGGEREGEVLVDRVGDDATGRRRREEGKARN